MLQLPAVFLNVFGGGSVHCACVLGRSNCTAPQVSLVMYVFTVGTLRPWPLRKIKANIDDYLVIAKAKFSWKDFCPRWWFRMKSTLYILKYKKLSMVQIELWSYRRSDKYPIANKDCFVIPEFCIPFLCCWNKIWL